MSVVTQEIQDQVSELYIAFFNRAPDADGFGFWASALATGQYSIQEIAAFFAQTPEVIGTYGGLTPEQQIDKLYTNILNRSADADGLAYWSEQLESGVPFSDIAYTLVNVVFTGGTGIAVTDTNLVKNKVAVAEYFAIDLASNDGALAATAFDGVTDDPATVTAKEAELNAEVNTGTTYTLTTGIDVITGGASNDTFIGQTGGSAAETTIQAGDRINGGGGTNEFDIYLGAATMAPMTVSNVQNFYLQSSVDNTGTGANFLNVSGAQQIWNNASTKNLIVSNVQSLATVGLKNVAGGDAELTTVQFKASLLEGDADEVTIVTSGSTDAGIIRADDNTGAGGVETFTISAIGTNKIKTLDFKTDAETLNITGAGKLTVTDSIANVTTIDGTDATGNLTLSSEVAKVDINTGSGDDKVTIAHSSAATEFSVSTNDGNDEIVFTNFDAAGDLTNDKVTVSGGEGVDTLTMLTAMADALSDLSAADYAKKGIVNDFEILKLSDQTTTADETVNIARLGSNITTVDYEAGLSDDGQTLVDIASGGTVVLGDASSAVDDKLAVTVKDASKAGSNDDVLNIKLDDAHAGATVVYGVISVANVETINIDSTSTKTTDLVAADKNDLDLIAANAVKVVITGDVYLDIGNDPLDAGTLSSIDASANTAGVDVSVNGASQGVLIIGTDKADILIGGSGADEIRAGDGDDTITGGAGNDLLIGGDGDDTFIFADTAANNGNDTINDFTVGTGNDVIDVDAFLGTVPSTLTVAGITSDTTIVDDAIITVNFGAAIADLDFGGDDFADLFAASGKALDTTVDGGIDALVVVQGTDETQVYFVDATGSTGTPVTLTSAMVAQTATLVDVTNNDAFVAANFT